METPRISRAGQVAAVRVILVRHALPDVDPAVPPQLWPLGAAGKAAARTLTLPADAFLVASTEPKAEQTLRAAVPGRPVTRDAGFDEVRRPAEWRDDHRERARAYVEGAAHPGWERQDEVAARFEAAITRHAAAAGDRPLVVGTHGMAMTTWLAARQLITGPPGAFWAALAFPDVMELSQAHPGGGSAPSAGRGRVARTWRNED